MVKSPMSLLMEMVTHRKREGWTSDEFYNCYGCSNFMTRKIFDEIWDDIYV